MFESDKIALVGQVSDVIMYVALTAGLLVFVIGYFAGARVTMHKIIACTLIVALVGTLALRLPIAVHDLITGKKSAKELITTTPTTPAKPPEKPSLVPSGEAVANLLLYIIWTSLLVGMGIFLYEAMTVSAREARQD